MSYVILTFFIFVGLMVWAAIRQAKSENKELTAMNDHIARLPGFTPALRYDNPRMALLIDPASSQFAIAEKGGGARAYRFDQLVAADVERNGTSLEKTNRGSQFMAAAVGGVLLGPLGLLMGGLTGSKRKEELVKRLSIKVFTNDLGQPVTEVVFFDSPSGVKPDHASVQVAAKQLEEWYGRLRTILQANERAPSTSPSHDEQTSPRPGPAAGFGRRRGLVLPG